jgi:hypothetical protein
VLSAISGAKNELLTAEMFAARASDFYSRSISRIYTSYERALRTAGAVDFDDLLLLTATMLERRREIREECHERWQYLMIDEYQDTNRAQFKIASLLVGTPDIRVDDVVGVAGFVQPDDRVDVLWTRFDRPASGRSEAAPAYTDLLLQNVRVLAIDQLADRGAQAKPAKAVTVEVTSQQSQKVALAAQVGQLSLALRQSGSSLLSEPQRVNLDDLGTNKRPINVPSPDQVSEPTTVVTITRGVTNRSLYEITPTGRREVKLGGNEPPPTQADQRPAEVAGKPE